MSYDGMEVSDGMQAGIAYEKLVHGDLNPKERQSLKKALLEYCSQDALAMVRLLEHLRR
jgi:hypothetical protein